MQNRMVESMEPTTWLAIKAAIAIIASGITAALGGCDAGLQLLLIVVSIDTVSGWLSAIKRKDFHPTVAFWGGVKKVLIFVIVVMAFELDKALAINFIRTAAIWFYIANEGASILSNCAELGLPVPPAVIEVLANIKSKAEVSG